MALNPIQNDATEFRNPGAHPGCTSGPSPHMPRRMLALLTMMLLNTAEYPRVDLGVSLADACIHETILRKSISEKLGYDPFDSASKRKITVESIREGQNLRIKVSQSIDGELSGERSLEGKTEECRVLLDTLALTIVLILDPLGSVQQQALEPREDQDHEATLPPQKTQPQAAKPPLWEPTEKGKKAKQALFFDLGPTAGSSPTVSFALELGYALKYRAFGLIAYLRGDYPSGLQVGAGLVRAAPLIATLGLCGNLKNFSFCGIAGGGAMLASGENINGGRQSSTPYADLGAKVTWRRPIGSKISLGLSTEIRVPLIRTTLNIGTSQVWSNSVVNGFLALSLGYQLLP